MDKFPSSSQLKPPLGYSDMHFYIAGGVRHYSSFLSIDIYLFDPGQCILYYIHWNISHISSENYCNFQRYRFVLSELPSGIISIIRKPAGKYQPPAIHLIINRSHHIFMKSVFNAESVEGIKGYEHVYMCFIFSLIFQ